MASLNGHLSNTETELVPAFLTHFIWLSKRQTSLLDGHLVPVPKGWKHFPLAQNFCFKVTLRVRAFHLSELAGPTIAGPVSLKMKQAFLKSFC